MSDLLSHAWLLGPLIFFVIVVLVLRQLFGLRNVARDLGSLERHTIRLCGIPLGRWGSHAYLIEKDGQVKIVIKHYGYMILAAGISYEEISENMIERYKRLFDQREAYMKERQRYSG